MIRTDLERVLGAGGYWLEDGPHGARYASGPYNSVWICRDCEMELDDSDEPCPDCHPHDDDELEGGA